MRKIAFVLLSLLIGVCLVATGQENGKRKGDVYYDVEVKPEYPGGQKALFEFIMKNVVYPETCKKEEIEGKVYVSFVIDKKGKVTNAKIERGVHKLLDEEALRVIKEMPDWTPGKEKGKKVKVQYTLPIKFALS